MNNIQNIYADLIVDPVIPARLGMDREKLDDLAISIKSTGLINPITVRSTGDKFEVVAGHRRFKACLQAGIVKIPCVVRALDDQETFKIRAHENLFRADLNPVEEATNISRALNGDESKIPELAKQLNRSVAWIEDRLNINTYPEYLIVAIANDKISLGVAKWLGKIEDDIYRKMFVDQAIGQGLAVWQAEHYFRQWEGGILKESSALIPLDEDSFNREPAKIIAKCKACGILAESPNLQNVFIHIKCPDITIESPQE